MKPTRPVVFIHGLKGSYLRTKTNTLRWLGWKQVLGIDQKPLALPLEWIDTKQACDKLIACGPVQRVLWRQVYRPFIKGQSDRVNSFHVFTYDWRRDNAETVTRFHNMLKNIVIDSGQSAQVIAHSLGGLIAYHVLNRAPELFHSVVFAGVPFGSGIGMIPDLHLGARVGINTSLLDSRAQFSWSSPWVFFPTSGDTKLRTRSGHIMDHDWFDSLAWEEKQFGVFANPSIDTTVYRQHLQHILPRARRFKEALRPSECLLSKQPPIMVLSSQSSPTLDTIIHQGPQANRGWDMKSAPKQAGDGRVPYIDSMPPKGLRYTTIQSTRRHDALLHDSKLIAHILDSFN